MDVIELHCPYCSMRLRLKDRRFVGRTVRCPDCKEELTIDRDGSGEIVCRATTDVQHATKNSSAKSPPQADSMTPPNAAKYRLSPALLGWGAGGLLALVFLALLLAGGSETDSRQSEKTSEQQESHRLASQPRPEQTEKPQQQSEKKPSLAEEPRKPLLVRRMEALGARIIEYRDQHGVYPAAPPMTLDIPQEQQFGWLAAIVAGQNPNGPQPLWDRPYNDPLNSQFVRRQMADFINPLFAKVVSEDGFPATHFVAIAGFGPDAATLPKDHPRAGLFGYNRQTRLEDIRDGAANTIMMVGVREQYPAWVSGGASTIRALTKEPFINGPDGFGTGQPDGMYVIMADGSVRFLRADLPADLIRSMVTMADGLPRAPNTPPDSKQASPPDRPMVRNDPPKDPPPSNPVKPAHPEDQRPIPVPMAPDIPTPKPIEYDINKALAQPILRFSQPEPVPFLRLLHQIEEMAAIPIDTTPVTDSPLADRLMQEVTLELEDTTVGEILETLVDQAGLKFETGKMFGIRILVPAS